MIRKNSVKGKALALLTGVMIMGASFTIFGADNSCGKDAEWSYNESEKELVITGKGKVKYSSEWYKLKIHKVVIKSGITGIEDYTFSDMPDLEKITLPNSVVSFGDYAFENTGIKNFKVTKNIKKMGNGVFSNCDNLETVDWNYKVIPNDTFYGSKNLKTVNMYNKIKKIGDSAFARSGIKSLDLPESIVKIGESAFYKTKHLKSFELPKSVKTIEPNTFSESSVEEVILNDGLKTIKESAFDSSKIKSIKITDSVEEIEERAFINCKKLVNLEIGNGITTINKETFDGCKSLSKVSFGNKVSFIGESSFNECKSLANVDFPSSLDTIDYAAFKNSGLVKVDLSKVGKNVDYWVFSDCDKLESVIIGSQIEEFHVNAIANCKSLKKIVIDGENREFESDGTSIMDKVDKTLLLVAGGVTGTYKIPKAVTSVDPEAFYGCVNITTFDVSENPRFKVIDDVLFRDTVYNEYRGLALVACPLTKTGSFTVPRNTIVIAASAFQNSKLTAVTIPNTVRYIGSCAFEECKGLKKMIIPGSVEKISNSAFWGCENLVRVQIKKGVKYIRRSAFRGCTNLKRIEIPKSVVRIAKSSFKGCEDVTFYCKKSSYAMSYASRKWFIKYKII